MLQIREGARESRFSIETVLSRRTEKNRAETFCEVFPKKIGSEKNYT